MPQVCVPLSTSQMAISLFPQFFFISILSAIICIATFTHAYSQCLHDQKTLLLELKNELIFNSSLSTKLVQWNQTNDCCSWDGVECDGAGHVTSLQLDNEFISGGVDENSSSLFSLRYLKKLNLAYNLFNGTQIPRGIGNLIYLTHLDLSYAAFSGQVPIELSLLRRLVSLDISNTYVASHEDPNLLYWNQGIPLKLEQPNLQMLLQNLTGLRELYLDSVDISAQKSEWYHVISSSLPDLRNLSLRHCGLSAPQDPSLSRFHSLTVLRLSGNNLSTVVPTFFANFSSLIGLSLRNCSLKGELPLPSQQAYYVDNSNNNFNKRIPPNIGNFTSYLRFFSLANNNLTGSIPTSLCDATNLEVLDLSVNNLTGNIPPCLPGNIENLLVFNLGTNNFSGDIPDKFSVNCGLKTLDLSDNNLGGSIPMSLRNCKSLAVMNVGNNNMSDSFPCMLSSSLRVLVLRSNRFHGEVRCHKSWSNLQIIDIASNHFSGYLYPLNFSSWGGMMLVSDARLSRNRSGFNILSPSYYYRDEVTLTIKGLELKLVKILPYFTSIDFSRNNFQGKIPDAIGDLNSLYLLNLSHNALTGTIPKSFGNLRQLGSLDLSVNQLAGTIPVELAVLTFLQVLNLSYNKLVGNIPIGSQLQTFPAASFEGNTGLCGLPLNVSCSDTDGPGNAQSHGKMEIEWDYVFAGLGYGVGLGTFFWVILCCRSLRLKYFEKVDEVLETIFDRQDRRKRHGRSRRALRNQVRGQQC